MKRLVSSARINRAVGYCRTSSEGQRDNTSIPIQKREIRDYSKRNKWRFKKFYIDECKSGAKIAGRDAFQQMMRDAAKSEFDIIVVLDLTRFGRDGADIIESCRTLARDFSIHVIEVRGGFDTRDPEKIVNNYVSAGVAESDRLRILRRCNGGRIERARNGGTWSGRRAWPVGRDFDEKAGKWKINSKGKDIAEVLERYLKGETLRDLCKEFGICAASKVSYWVHHSQLAGDYIAVFKKQGLRIKVPGIPDVVSPELLARVQKRLRHNRVHNRVDVKSYPLTGFLRCGVCKAAMSGKTEADTGIVRYRHHQDPKPVDCHFHSVRADDIQAPILDHLYNTFLDEPAFNAAVDRAMPSVDQRKALVSKRERTAKLLKRNETEQARLVQAVRKGASPRVLIDAQDELNAVSRRLNRRLKKLDAKIGRFPDAEATRAAAAALRYELAMKYWKRDWRNLSSDEIKRFLLNLFGETGRNAGIFVSLDERGRIIAEFKGRVSFSHKIMDGRPETEFFRREVRRANREIERTLSAAHRAAKKARREALLNPVDHIQPAFWSSPE